MHRFFPVGTLVVFPERCGLVADVPAAHWRDGAPLIELGTRLVRDLAGAERTYLLSFSEVSAHFHLILLPRTAELRRVTGKIAGPLLAEVIRDEAPDAVETQRFIARCRARLADGERRPR
jgi:hypothetical protein